MEMEMQHRMEPGMIEDYKLQMGKDEKSFHTIQKYVHDITNFYSFLPEDKMISKLKVLEWKKQLQLKYAVSSANSMLVAVNRFLKYEGWDECCVRLMKFQRRIFCEERRELSQKEYEKLVHTARTKGDKRLSLVIETICSTGIRVSELQYITREAVQGKQARIFSKGKYRMVFLPAKLCSLLKHYAWERKITAGPLFRTRSGRPLDRSNIWHDMKELSYDADVEPSKVFPHNLRHLFARMFYKIDKDIAKLADILGHSSIETTRIYMISTGAEHAREIARLGLVI